MTELTNERAAVARCEADQTSFEAWARSHGGLPLDRAGDHLKTDDGLLHFPTYKFGRTEIAWRAWANKPGRATPSSECALPPLPEPTWCDCNPHRSHVYTAEQVEQIRREAVEADRRARASIDGQLTGDPLPVKKPASAAQDWETLTQWGAAGIAIGWQDDREMYVKVSDLLQPARQSQEPQALLKCSKCGADRSKDPCGNVQDCGMIGTAYAAPAHPVAQPALRGSDAQAVQPPLMRQAVASVASNADGKIRVNWMRPERVEAGTLLYCATEEIAAPLAAQAQEAEQVERRDWENASQPWTAYPLGTKARESWSAGFWLKTERGWKWHLGSTFPTPGGANQVLLPSGQVSAQDSAAGEKS